jgi:hypothetical protein
MIGQRLKAIYSHRSLCPCGHPALRDDVPLGTVYEVNPARKAMFVFCCGGCGHCIDLPGIYVEARGKGSGGYLPSGIFEIDEGQSPQGESMKTETEIKKRLTEIDADERYHYSPATVFENAPLALIQTALETEARALAWVLGISPPKQRRKAKR